MANPFPLTSDTGSGVCQYGWKERARLIIGRGKCHAQRLIEQLRYRIEKNPVDLVISVLMGANRFLLSYGQELFPGVPMIFAIPGTRDLQ